MFFKKTPYFKVGLDNLNNKFVHCLNIGFLRKITLHCIIIVLRILRDKFEVPCVNCKVFQNECTRYVFKSILKLLLAIWRSCSVHCVKLWWMSFGFDKQLWCKIKIFGEVKASSFLRYGFTIIVFPFYWKLL